MVVRCPNYARRAWGTETLSFSDKYAPRPLPGWDTARAITKLRRPNYCKWCSVFSKKAPRCGGMSIIKEIIAWILSMVRIAQKNKKGGGFPQEQCVCVCVWSSCGGAAGWNVINYAGGTLTYIVFRSLRWWLMGDGAAAAASDEFFPLKNSLWHANSSSF